MVNTKKHFYMMILIGGIALLPSLYFAYLQMQENKIVDEYLSLNNFVGLPLTKETAVRISNQVKQDFNTNESSFVALELVNRPFLREDVGFLLTHKEGVCGEGTRVIVNLLNRLGFDATRITLYNKKLQSAHTLVSVLDGDQEYLVDSINSSGKVSRLLEQRDISSADFNLLHYSDSLASRRAFVKSDSVGEPADYVDFFERYWLYSYEAAPYTKLITKMGADVRVFNFDRPPYLLSTFAEKPYSILSLFSALAAVVFMFIFFFVFYKLNTIDRSK